MKYNYFDIEDFLTDPEFINWVKKGSLEQNTLIQNWLNTKPPNKKAALTAREILLNLNREKLDPDQEEKETSLQRILSHHPEKNTAGKKTVWLSVMKWAAAFIFITGFLYFFIHESKNNDSVAPIKYITKANPLGQKSRIKLPDGSTVNLNAGSQIVYADNFAQQRHLSLEGEAFFDVVPNKDLPFKVNAENLEITVVGTSFNVRSFDEDDSEEVIVMSGKVLTSHISQIDSFQTLLSKNEMLRYSKASGDFVKTQADTMQLAWKDGILHFSNAGFEEVVHQLERWYGLGFVFPKQGPAYIPGKINGSFDHMSLEEVLEGLKFSVDIEYKIDAPNKKVLIQPT